jgi:GNAT superfamily N-acetyltransferase
MFFASLVFDMFMRPIATRFVSALFYTMPIDIRLATIEDIPALQEMIRESVSVLSADYYSSKQIASGLSHVFGVDTQLILDGSYFLAEVNKQIAASGGWSKRKTLFGGDQSKSNRSDPLLDAATEAARIRAFYVHPRWSRRGIASLILKSCEDAARSAGFHQVELAATLPGVPFYLARGYQKAEEVAIETPDGESLPAFRMSKTLSHR